MNIRSWPFWILVIAVASGPWFGVVRHPQWERVTWIPFHGAEDKPKDVLVNFLLFVPFGWSFAKSPAFAKPTAGKRSSRRTLGAAIATAAVVSNSVHTRTVGPAPEIVAPSAPHACTRSSSAADRG